jgi:hypothetical protein
MLYGAMDEESSDDDDEDSDDGGDDSEDDDDDGSSNDGSRADSIGRTRFGRAGDRDEIELDILGNHQDDSDIISIGIGSDSDSDEDSDDSDASGNRGDRRNAGDDGTVRTSLHAHPLGDVGPQPRHLCDVCATRLDSARQSYRCVSGCDYDVCRACLDSSLMMGLDMQERMRRGRNGRNQRRRRRRGRAEPAQYYRNNRALPMASTVRTTKPAGLKVAKLPSSILSSSSSSGVFFNLSRLKDTYLSPAMRSALFRDAPPPSSFSSSSSVPSSASSSASASASSSSSSSSLSSRFGTDCARGGSLASSTAFSFPTNNNVLFRMPTIHQQHHQQSQSHHRTGAFLPPSAASAADTDGIHIGFANDRDRSNHTSSASDSRTESLPPFSHDDAVALIGVHRHMYDRLWSTMWRGARHRLAAALRTLMMTRGLVLDSTCDIDGHSVAFECGSVASSNGSVAVGASDRESEADAETDASFAERWGKCIADANADDNSNANDNIDDNHHSNRTVSIPRLLEALLRWRGEEYRIFYMIGACLCFSEWHFILPF